MTTVAQATAYKAARFAVGGCVECTRPAIPPYKRYCARHLLGHRAAARRYSRTEAYSERIGRGRRPILSDDDLRKVIAHEDAVVAGLRFTTELSVGCEGPGDESDGRGY